MDKNEVVWAGVIAVLCICITIMSIVAIKTHNQRQLSFIEHGYTRTTLPGTLNPQWIKE